MDYTVSALFYFFFKKSEASLTAVAQWVGCRPANQKVAGSIPGQGTCLVYSPDVQLGGCNRQPIDVSLSLSFSLYSPPSKNK